MVKILKSLFSLVRLGDRCSTWQKWKKKLLLCGIYYSQGERGSCWRSTDRSGLYLFKGPKSKIADPNSKQKMPQNDLFFDLWPLTFWPMTSPFGDLLAITKTHLGYKFHQDSPMGTWWKVVDSLTHSLTHWLTHKVTSNGWAMPPNKGRPCYYHC